MTKKIKLAKQYIDYLANQPEHGMGYQIVEVTLQDGKVLKNRAVMNATYLMLSENEEINADEITCIKLADKKT